MSIAEMYATGNVKNAEEISKAYAETLRILNSGQCVGKVLTEAQLEIIQRAFADLGARCALLVDVSDLCRTDAELRSEALVPPWASLDRVDPAPRKATS